MMLPGIPIAFAPLAAENWAWTIGMLAMTVLCFRRNRPFKDNRHDADDH